MSYDAATLVPIGVVLRDLSRDGYRVEPNKQGAFRVSCACGSQRAVIDPNGRALARSTARHVRRMLACGCQAT